MANSKNNQNTDVKNNSINNTASGATSKENSTQEVEVLYQKLGGQWYAFSMINDEVFMAPVAEDKIDEIRREKNDVAA